MPPRKPPRPAVRRAPRQQRAHDTVAVILEAAQQILRAHGLAGFNTNRIAERAGVSVGSLYGYFPNKQSILLALARRLLAEDREAFLAALAAADDAHDAEADPIRRLVRVLLARHAHDAPVRRVLLGVYMGAGLAGDDAQHVAQLTAAVASHPQGPQAARALAPIQLFVIARAVLGVARALTDAREGPPLPMQAVEDEAVRLVNAYLRAAVPAESGRSAAAMAQNSASSSARMPGSP
ncbi:TetR/AcrR family transcriptional regulator [Pseudacidovorax intermedius]|uniref:TetR/AcrR family transcriptional regulator n=1 Tax=Pseudacidovorax intermedius TaxID=433924 RepID=UPI0026EED1BD|nr:TetR/AcrR family transcriptional regulator [Pseudacidovorax intermedius]